MIASILKLASLALLPAAAPSLDLARLEARIESAIESWDSQPDASARAEWKNEARAVVAAWTGFRDRSCDPGLIAFEHRVEPAEAGRRGERCRAAFDRLIVEDLGRRYDPAGAAGSRPSLDPAADARPFLPEDPEAIDCPPPPEPECDYCAIDRCWEAKLAQDERELAASWSRLLAAVRERSGLSPAQRREWAVRLGEAQQAWIRLRDADCRLQTWETPNRWGRANFSMIEAPCRHAETRARIERLAAILR